MEGGEIKKNEKPAGNRLGLLTETAIEIGICKEILRDSLLDPFCRGFGILPQRCHQSLLHDHPNTTTLTHYSDPVIGRRMECGMRVNVEASLKFNPRSDSER